MNEIVVRVNQEPGTITWNFEEIKKYLEAELNIFQTTAYTDDTIKAAKSDIANLRKLAATIEERRKEVKEQYLQPYNVIEAQAKELVALIEKPIQAINEQVKDYERRRKEAAKAEIMDYWNQKAVVLPEDIREKAKAAIYDSRWENATATKKSWREGIDNGIQKILDEIATIKSFASDFEEDAMTVYKMDLSLQKAIQKMNELKAQQERILEMERQKKEREEREARERQEAEERRRAAQQEAQKPASAYAPPAFVPHSQEEPVSVQPQTAVNQMISGANIPHPAEQEKMVQPEPATMAYPGGKAVRLLITGTPEQIEKIQAYIKFTGASYQEV